MSSAQALVRKEECKVPRRDCSTGSKGSGKRNLESYDKVRRPISRPGFRSLSLAEIEDADYRCNTFRAKPRLKMQR
jgi:hypothetical protein